jgi:hypothetical protein
LKGLETSNENAVEDPFVEDEPYPTDITIRTRGAGRGKKSQVGQVQFEAIG